MKMTTKDIPGDRIHYEATVIFHDDGSLEFVQADENVWLSPQQFARASLFWRDGLLENFPLLRHLVTQ